MRWLVVVVLAGCYSPTPPEGAPCSGNGTCPRPLVCDVDNVCRKTPVDAASDDAPPADAPNPDAPNPDAPPAACTPAPTGNWSNRDPIGVSAASIVDGTPSVTGDGLELFWKSDRGGSLDIWHATRATPNGSWGSAAEVVELSSPLRDGSPEITRDGLTIYFASERATGMALMNDIFVATRPDRSSPFGTPVIVPALSSPADEEGVTVNPAGTVAYLHSNRGGGAYHIYRSTRASAADPWGTPVEVAELTDADYENPWVSADDCRMYVQSTRGGASGTEDLWLVTRPAPGMPWGAPDRINPPSGPGFQGDPWVSPDEHTLIYADGGSGLSTLDLYQLVR